MFTTILGIILTLIVLSVLFSLFLPIFLVLGLVFIISRFDLKNGILISIIIGLVGYLITDDVLSLTNILMFPLIVYVFKRFEPQAFEKPLVGPNYFMNVESILKLILIAAVFMGIGSLFSSLVGWVFGLSVLLGLILLIPLLIVCFIVSNLIFVFVVIPLTGLIKTLF